MEPGSFPGPCEAWSTADPAPGGGDPLNRRAGSRRTGWASGWSRRSLMDVGALAWPPSRGVSHCYQRPPTPTALRVITRHTAARKRVHAILDGSPPTLLQATIAPSSTPSTEFKRSRLHYFPTLRPLGGLSTHRRAGPGAVPAALGVMPRRGQFHRYCDALDRPHPTPSSGRGAHIYVDHRYVDWVSSWGPLIFGHAYPLLVEAPKAAGRGTTLSRRPPGG